MTTVGNANQSESIDEPADAAIRRMTSFAVMTVDWSSHRSSYLDNFVNYALAVIPGDSPTAFPREAVRPSILERFNLPLPTGIVNQLLKRATKLGFLEEVTTEAVRLTEKGKREVAPIPYTLKKLNQEQATVIERFMDWVQIELGVTLTTERAEAMMLDYIETYYCSLMSLAETSSAFVRKLPQIEPTSEQKVAAAFIASIAESDEALFESVANMARGSMMVSALYSPTLVDTTRGFRHTTIYFDTKIVLRALGYEGDAAQQATLELVQLLKRQGARLAVFEFTLAEIRSVIDSVGMRARNGSMWTARPGSVESYFYKLDASNSLIEQHSIRVESKILDIGLQVDPKPPYDNHRYVIDGHVPLSGGVSQHRAGQLF
jgi:hypothetical protein